MEVLKDMKSFRRSIKGISPIFATLILIAIAVIAGIVVYMFTSGTIGTLIGGGTAGQEKIAVQSANGAATSVTLIVQQTGGPNAIPTNMIIKDTGGNTVATCPIGTPTPALTNGAMVSGTLYTIPSGTITFTNGATALSGTYTATLVTKAGGSFVSPTFTV